LQKFIDDYRKAIGGLIVFTNVVPWKEKNISGNINELYADPRASYYSEDGSGFPEEFYMVAPQKGDLVVTKNNYDVFSNPEFEWALKKHNIRYLVITGIFGDGCVLATICGGFSRGYNFVILKDLIETTDVKVRQNLLKLLKEYTWPIMYGRTMDSKDFLKEWAK
jgi:nicotinamidase-related amidase